MNKRLTRTQSDKWGKRLHDNAAKPITPTQTNRTMATLGNPIHAYAYSATRDDQSMLYKGNHTTQWKTPSCMATMQGSAQKDKSRNYFRAMLTAPVMLTCEPSTPLSAGSELKPPPLLTEVKTTYLPKHR